MTRAANLSKIVTDANLEGTLDVTGVLTGTSLDISGDIDVDGTTNLDVVDIDGAVDMASTLGVAGVVTANAGVVVDNITIDGTEIDLSSGDLTLDVAGNILLNADGGGVYFQDASTLVGSIQNSSSDLVITSEVQDKDILFKGDDGGASVTALTLDMSAAGNATFNGTVLASNGTSSLPSLSFSGDTNTGIYRPSSDNLGFAIAGSARAFMSATQFNMTGNGVFSGTLTASSGNITISDGNLVVASGHGIDFGATANSGAGTEQELLDDYEEGTWTPALVGLSNTPSFHNNVGRYTKVGRVCTAQFFQQTNVNPTFSTGTNAFKISGLPFAVFGHGYTGSQGTVSAQGFNYIASNNNQSVGGGSGGASLSASVNSSEQMQFQVTNSGGTRGEVNNNGAAQGYIIEATVTYFTTD